MSGGPAGASPLRPSPRLTPFWSLPLSLVGTCCRKSSLLSPIYLFFIYSFISVQAHELLFLVQIFLKI